MASDWGEDPSHSSLALAPTLTRREATVLELLATGLSSAAIARRLSVSTKAIEYHIGNLISKFGVDNRTGLISVACFLGYLSLKSWPPSVVKHEPHGT